MARCRGIGRAHGGSSLTSLFDKRHHEAAWAALPAGKHVYWEKLLADVAKGKGVVINQSAWGGASACSGLDKQTLRTANTTDQGDNFKAMDEDTAYVEAAGSPRMMALLQYVGLPLPQAA